MRHLLLCLAISFSCYTYAQESVKDSIFKNLETHVTKDSTRVRHLINAANYVTYNDPNHAFSLVEEALKISSEINWTKGKAFGLRQMGVVYYSLSDNFNAMEAFQEALKTSSTMPNNKLFDASLYNNLGNIYADLKLFEKALTNYNKLLSIAKQSNRKEDQIRALVNIGTVQIEKNLVDEGIMNLDNALVLATEENNDFYIAAILNNLGMAYKAKKDYSKSTNHYKRALELSDQIKSKYTQATALNSLGKISILLEDYESAKTFSTKGLKVAQEIEAIEWQADAWETLNKVYEYDNDHIEALIAYKNHIKLRDSVISEEKIAELTRKEMQFKIEQQETLANAEISRQKLIRNASLLGGSGLALASIISFILYRRKRDAISQKKEAQFNTKVADTELKALRAQMNPHFIFNSLNSINEYVSKNDIESATNYLTKFSKLMRETLEKSTESEILLEEDIQILKTYMDIENKRTNNNFTYSIIIDDAINPENTLIPPMILQPFVENSIIHGLGSFKKNGHITISYKKNENMMICSVEDNGIGRKKSSELKANHNKQSLGMTITKNRIDILNKKRNTNGSVNIIDKTDGTKIEIKLPLTLAY
ncbi:tetratricopeptide repeat protein [Psychroserpens mesophilus]|uniref:tetratricopeptide repeat protein n=1 Tax=Psychroserpens mesophilus TaxID=325473 RepID=UPI00058CF10E|nr:tetratricopeptide repeat protein [Psychroserpens mesophilus]